MALNCTCTRSSWWLGWARCGMASRESHRPGGTRRHARTESTMLVLLSTTWDNVTSIFSVACAQ
jgi:hypothetical protein